MTNFLKPTWAMIAGMLVMSVILPAVFTYSLPYLVNVAGIFFTSCLVMFAAYGVACCFTKQ